MVEALWRTVVGVSTRKVRSACPGKGAMATRGSVGGAALAAALGGVVLAMCFAPHVSAQARGGARQEITRPGAPPVDGDTEARARQLFELGRTAFDAGLYEDALRYFRQSYELSGRAALLWNVGVSADRLRRDDEAIEAFERYLREVPQAPNRVEVVSRLEALQRARARSAGAGGAQAEGGARADGARPEGGSQADGPAGSGTLREDGAGESAGDGMSGASAPQTRDAALRVSLREGEEARDEGGGSVLSKAWFWAVVGGATAVVVGAVVLGLVLGGGPSLPDTDFVTVALR
jgi:tetratricopeptide (TPR) repeat protein